MIQRILTALVLIPLVLLLILRAPVWLLTIVAGIVALLAIREFLALTRHYGVEPFSIATCIFTGMFFAIIIGPFALVLLGTCILAGLMPFVFLALGMRRESLRSIYPAAAASVFAFTYIALPMGLLVALRSWRGEFHVVFLMLVVWSGDIFAYFVGKSLGRHKMSPRISPKKTWEGAYASLIASIFFGTCLYHFSLPINSWLLKFHLLGPDSLAWDQHRTTLLQVILLSAAVNAAAQLGDLVESAIKRGADVKDSGAILPGHGGMLDRIDAMLFAAPVLLLCLMALT